MVYVKKEGDIETIKIKGDRCYHYIGVKKEKEKSELQYWENKNGEKIAIKDMNSDYIARCITLIQRHNWRREYEQPLMNELKKRGDERNYIFPVIQSWEIERTPEQQERDEWFWSQD